MRKKLLPLILFIILVFAPSTVTHAYGGCYPPIRPCPSETIQPSSVDIELEGKIINYKISKQINN